MKFGEAIEELKAGKRVAREGWNGKGMWLCFMPPFTLAAGMVNSRTRPLLTAAGYPADKDVEVGGYVVMWTAQGVWQPGWLASQADILADDWAVLS